VLVSARPFCPCTIFTEQGHGAALFDAPQNVWLFNAPDVSGGIQTLDLKSMERMFYHHANTTALLFPYL